MTAALPGDVIRIIEKHELPPRAREIPEGFDPLAEGVFMKHQTEWVRLCQQYDLMIADKGRRTGITWATGLDSSITVSSQRDAGGDNVYYVGDTHDKGLEFIGYVAHMLKVMAVAMADGYLGIELFLFKDQQPDGSTKNITAYRIRTAAGFQCVALSSNPSNIRGLQGIVIIDEAAFHKNVDAVIEAALALIIWGGKIRIISTHNGDKNPFNQLIKDSLAGIQSFHVFRVTFDDAVENGLFERVCLIKGWTPTPERKREWYNKIRGAYGNRRAAMLEELDGIPRESSGVAIPGILIENCMHEERPIVRLELENDFAVKPVDFRESWCASWIEIHIKPLLALFDPDKPHCFGEDYGRYADLSVLVPGEITETLQRKVPFVIELHNVPTRQQEQIFWYIIDNMPNFMGGAMDATGNGFGLAESTADKYGHNMIAMIKLSESWYRENMPAVEEGFQDQVFDLPKSDNLKNDIRALQRVNGVIKPPSVRQQDVDKGTIKRHCDAGIALSLMHYASRQDVERFGYEAVNQNQNGDAIARPVRTGLGWNNTRGGLL